MQNNIKLILGNCLEKMKELPNNSIDTIITDPPYGLSFMGKKWDYDVPSIEIWKEALRVLKPGGTALIFAGSRTQHRMAVKVEDAGFILKDTIMYMYGSGFPKATDISKQLDKEHERKIIGKRTIQGTIDIQGGNYNSGKTAKKELDITEPTTSEAKLWNGWKSHALKPSYESILVCQKPNDGTYANNALKWGVSGLNIDGGRIGTEKRFSTPAKAKKGTFNCSFDDKYKGQEVQGRFPANIILDEEAGKMLDEQSGESKSTIGKRNPNGKKDTNAFGDYNSQPNIISGHNDKGGASRFFKNIKIDNVCHYCYTDTKLNNKENLCQSKNKFAQFVEKSGKNINQIIEPTAQQNATQSLNEKSVQLVKYVGNLCDLCGMSIVQELVKIKNLVSKNEELQAIQDFIGNYRKCILIQNLASYVENLDNIDTTPTTKNLLKLFGYVLPAIRKYIQKIEKSEPKRFLYCAKASKSERNRGCEGLEKRVAGSMQANEGKTMDLGGASLKKEHKQIQPKSNFHPTVKPLKLMEYLCTLTKTPTGGMVLDPFMGSGTTGIACINTGRDFIGIELDKEYFEIAKQRLKQRPLL